MFTLVTGGAGYIGSHLVYDLIQIGRKVIVVDNFSTGFREALPADVLICKIDINQPEQLEQVFLAYPVSHVFHLAAKTKVDESIEKPIDYYQTNTLGTLNLIQKCIEFKVQSFVFSSTAAVYKDAPNTLQSEESELDPSTPYGHSKMMAEKLIEFSFKNTSVKYCILRYFNVAGAQLAGTNGQRSKNATHLFKVVCEVATSQRSLMQVYGTDYSTEDGTCIRDFIHIEDISQIHILAENYILKNGTSDIFNCGYSEGFSVLQVINSFEKLINKKIHIDYLPRRKGDLMRVVADNSKLRNKLNWKPKYNDLDLICKSALAWEKKILSHN